MKNDGTIFVTERNSRGMVIFVHAWHDAAWERESREMEEHRISMRNAEIVAENIQARHGGIWLRGLKKRDFPVSAWRSELENKLMLEY